MCITEAVLLLWVTEMAWLHFFKLGLSATKNTVLIRIALQAFYLLTFHTHVFVNVQVISLENFSALVGAKISEFSDQLLHIVIDWNVFAIRRLAIPACAFCA